MRREQIHPYVRSDVRQRLREYGAAKGVTETSVVEAALKDYLDDSRDNVLIMRRLDRLGRADARIQRDIEVLSEAFAVFVRIWSTYLPEIGAQEKDGAKLLAASRYDQFLELVARQFSAGKRLVDDIVKEQAADADELRAAAAELSGRGADPRLSPDAGRDGRGCEPPRSEPAWQRHRRRG